MERREDGNESVTVTWGVGEEAEKGAADVVGDPMRRIVGKHV
jgi:hypothetical protein